MFAQMFASRTALLIRTLINPPIGRDLAADHLSRRRSRSASSQRTTVPQDRGARPVRWWHYPMAVFLPLLGVIPGGLVATVLRKVLGVQFLPGVE